MNLSLLENCNVNAELANRNLIDFVTYIKDNYETNWHHLLLCEKLDRFISGDIKKLMVFMPPQHGKSELVSRMLPAYILGKYPKSKIVIASYSSDLSTTFNRDCQRYIDSDKYKDVFPKTILNGSRTVTSGNWLRNSEIFETVGFGGFLKTVGVGGSLTGTPADFAIIDDPVKDSIEAMSPTYQQRNWDWYNDVLCTRLHNNSRILITQTRWDENDLSGLILKKQQELGLNDWDILVLPAIKENDLNKEDPRQIGEALWENRHSKKRLLEVQKQSIRTFQSLYQQNPQPTQAGGEFYDMFKIESNVGKFQYNPRLALHLTFDFNARPAMHAGVWQIVIKDGIKTAYKIKEFKVKKTVGICDAFKRWMPVHTSGLVIYGDPSGNNEDTRSEDGFNDYSIIRRDLAKYHPSLRVAKSHPSVAGRGDFINTVFNFGIPNLRFYIDENCHLSIKDFLYIKQDSDRTKLKAKMTDPDTGKQIEKYGHLSDADDYFFCMAFPSEYLIYQQGGPAFSNVKVGKRSTRNGF